MGRKILPSADMVGWLSCSHHLT